MMNGEGKMEFPAVNYLAVLAAAASAFVLGGLWYSPILFAKKWMAYTGNECAEGEQPKGNMGVIFGGAFLLSVIAAYVFALVIPASDLGLKYGAIAGAMTGFAFAATSFGISYLFEQRPFGLWLINGGYHTLQFTLYGLVLGLMGPVGEAAAVY
jgi:hypothetical protein